MIAHNFVVVGQTITTGHTHPRFFSFVDHLLVLFCLSGDLLILFLLHVGWIDGPISYSSLIQISFVLINSMLERDMTLIFHTFPLLELLLLLVMYWSEISPSNHKTNIPQIFTFNLMRSIFTDFYCFLFARRLNDQSLRSTNQMKNRSTATYL